jgi:P-type Cu2+ transporter
MKSVMGASKALEALARLMPSDAHQLMPDGSVKDVPLSALALNDKVLVKPGEKVPADGAIVKGESSVDEAMLTGESTPVAKTIGGTVIGGSINGEGALTIEVQGTGKDSFLSQVIELVKQAQDSKSKTQNLADTAAMWLTLLALVSGAGTFLVWLLFMDRELAFAIERAVTVMVITCPHALGLAVPLVVAVSTALAASHGLLIRNRVAFEGARKLQAVIFDKTGTLTAGRFGVTDTLVLAPDIDEDTLRRYAASVDASSEHPIAKAIAAASETKLSVEDFQSIPGKGAEGKGDGRQVKVVSPGYLRAHRTPAGTRQDGGVHPRRRAAEGRDGPGRHRPARGEAGHRRAEGAEHPVPDAHRRQPGDSPMGGGPARAGRSFCRGAAPGQGRQGQGGPGARGARGDDR